MNRSIVRSTLRLFLLQVSRELYQRLLTLKARNLIFRDAAPSFASFPSSAASSIPQSAVSRSATRCAAGPGALPLVIVVLASLSACGNTPLGRSIIAVA